MKAIILVLILFMASCSNDSIVELKSEQIRIKFKNHLTALSPINYIEIFGRTPSERELALGRNLSNDPILSRNNDVSCATCHLSNHGFADGNSLTVGALGLGGPSGNDVGKKFSEGKLSIDRGLGDDGRGFKANSFMFRNSLSTINVAYRMNKNKSEGLFHDGRFGSLFFQTLLPIHTSIEMCGDNPISRKNNLFAEGGVFFKTKVKLTHVNSFDPYSGRETGFFNAAHTTIKGVPTMRPNGTLSIPGRNECLAIAIAKLKTIPYYRNEFKSIYKSEIKDNLIAIALTAYVSTHVSKETAFDEFVSGENSLTDSQLTGLALFFTKMGQTVKIGEKVYKGAGCYQCHSGPTFGGIGYSSLGVKGSQRSPLSRPKFINKRNSSFFGRIKLQRGELPKCHIEGLSISREGLAPDMGRASGSFKTDDCFKFRVPPLRNIIETFPYFHHGTALAQDVSATSYRERSLKGLEQVIRYHLRGPVDHKLFARNNLRQGVFYDKYHQKDFFIPYFAQNFISTDNNKLNLTESDIFPINLNDEEVTGLVDFVAYSLWDRKSTTRGDLGNPLGHPIKVPSGFTPSVTRDIGNQLEIPPNYKIE